MTETLSPALPADVETLIEQVLQAASMRRLQLATAESCTGGLIASALTDVDGWAHVFDRGFVVYSSASKQEVLDVSEAVIQEQGPVCEPVARAMAEGALRRSHADVSVAVTGFTGPAGPGDTPGLVHLAAAVRGGPTIHRVERFGAIDRGEGRLATLRAALVMLKAAMDGDGGS
jgi:nicotinamide-nucleotide amidase